jgi:hypothetical protein
VPGRTNEIYFPLNSSISGTCKVIIIWFHPRFHVYETFFFDITKKFHTVMFEYLAQKKKNKKNYRSVV